MIQTPRYKYYGDKDKAKADTLKAQALNFYQSVCENMGDALTTRQNIQLDKHTIIQTTVSTDAQGNKTGIIEIYVKNKNTNTTSAPTLYCTSYTTGDTGTQLYKTPFQPEQQGQLLTPDNNPTGLILPAPTYKTRRHYHISHQEKNCISWEYINTREANTNRRRGKIAIQGIETGLNYGLYCEPLCCALLSDTELLVIHQYRKESAKTHRELIIYQYSLDFDNAIINLTPKTTFNLTDAGYHIQPLIGFMDDNLTLIYTEKGDIKYLVFNDDYLSIKNTDTLYQCIPYTSLDDNYNIENNNDIVSQTLKTPLENYTGYIDIRGDTVSFCIEILKTHTLTRQEAMTPYGILYWKIYNENKTWEYQTAYWKNNILTRRLLETGRYNHQSNKDWNEEKNDYTGNYSTNQQYCYAAFYAKKLNECIYNTCTEQTTGTWENGKTQNNQNSKIISTRTGIIYQEDTANILPIIDYCYTTTCLIAYIDPITYILDVKQNLMQTKQLTLQNLSVTKLPNV